ncbi:MAG: hypothetical protein P8Y64_04905 [Gammaproteobacteria bacterium]|jgi:hypothetical protein
MVDEDILSHELSLPEGHGRDGVVHWHIFRDRDQAEQFLPCIKLTDSQQLVGGYTRDSLGKIWWLGVQVSNVDQWGNRTAVNKHGASP